MGRFGGAAGRGAGILVAAVVLVGAAITVAPAAGKALTKKKADARYVNVGERASDSDLLDGTDSQDYAKDSEVVPAVLAADGPGSGLDADTVDGSPTATSETSGAIYVSDVEGNLPSNSVHGAAIENTDRSILIPIHELDEAYTTGTFPAKTMVSSSPALGFDAATDETISFVAPVPSEGVASGGFTLRLLWSITTTSGVVRWGFSARSVDAGQAVDSGGTTFTSAGSDFPVEGTSDGRAEADFGLANVIGQGETMFVSVFRDANGAGDTATGDAHLHAIEILYNAEQ